MVPVPEVTNMKRLLVAAAAFLVLGSSVLAPAALAEEPGSGPAPWKEPPKTEELLRLFKEKDSALRAAAAREAASNQDPALTTPLGRLLVDEDREVRLACVATLAGRTDDRARKSAAGILGERLTTLGEKGEHEERLALVGALHDLAQPGSLKTLVDGIKNDTEKDEVEARLRAVGNIPSPDAIEALIDFAASHGRGNRSDWNAATRNALRYATRADAGGADPDLWRAWWRKNGKTFDFDAAAADRKKERDEKAEKERRKAEAEEKRASGGDKGKAKGKNRKKDGDGEKKDGDGDKKDDGDAGKKEGDGGDE